MVVLSPCPGKTIVSSGKLNSLEWIEFNKVSALHPGSRNWPTHQSRRQCATPLAVLAASWSVASPKNSRYGLRIEVKVNGDEISNKGLSFESDQQAIGGAAGSQGIGKTESEIIQQREVMLDTVRKQQDTVYFARFYENGQLIIEIILPF